MAEPVTIILGIAALVATLATTAASAGSKAAEERELTAKGKEAAKKRAGQERQLERQDDRERNLGTLARQTKRRQAAQTASRQVSTLPTRTPQIRAPQAPPMPQAPQAAPSPVAQGAGVATTPAIQPTQTGLTGSDVVDIAKIGADVAGTAIEAAGQKSAAMAQAEQDRDLAAMQDEEFNRVLNKRKKDVNLQALDFQDAMAAGPAKTSRELSFNQDLAGILRGFNKNRMVA